jgi:5-methylcytosine-specific restriction enzyme A
MASRPLRPCAKIGCRNLVTSGYCEEHRKEREQVDHHATRRYDRQRGTSAARGYDNTWVKFRAIYLAHNPLCIDCLADNIYEPATEVHHIVELKDGGARLDPDNCAALCKKHHNKRHNRW